MLDALAPLDDQPEVCPDEGLRDDLGRFSLRVLRRLKAEQEAREYLEARLGDAENEIRWLRRQLETVTR